MYPHLDELKNFSSGIAQVVKYYFKYLPEFGIELVRPGATSYDLDAGHAAAHPGAMVHHSHGLLWTAEFKLGESSWKINGDLVEAARKAREITVPSSWVAMPFWRDMRRPVWIVPHGVEWAEWQHDRENLGYVLWAKNRVSDGLDPRAVMDMARALPDVEFVCTFAPPDAPPNVKVLRAALPHDQMKIIVQQAGVLIASDRETWGILPAEAMAAGVPVLSVNSGAVPSFMLHGVAGYCYKPGDLQDAIKGLRFCLAHHRRLGENGRELARRLTWHNAIKIVRKVYEMAMMEEKPTVDVIIPCHNYGDKLGDAIESAAGQTYDVQNILVVDDSSSDNTEEVAHYWMESDRRVRYLRSNFHNVAEARNLGIFYSDAKYVVPLDADDAIEPGFVERLVAPMEKDIHLGAVYTGVRVVFPDGTMALPWDWKQGIPQGAFRSRHKWPGEFNFDDQAQKRNQVPTCCLIRRKTMVQLGGYRARYAPGGAGSEDAELFLRMGAAGWGLRYVPSEDGALFVHRTGKGHVSGAEGYEEPNWINWHPWTRDGLHPFASMATPEKHCHAVRSYERPTVSVIIPVGPGHQKELVDALDSLEAQAYRDWEAIVVLDGVEFGGERDDPAEFWPEEAKQLFAAYPYVRWLTNSGEPKGAGWARNFGAEQARGLLLAFLDADDYYHPLFLDRAVNAFSQTGYVIYADFVSRINKQDHKTYGGKIVKEMGDQILVFDSFDDYDCKRAIERPEGERPYVWSGVTVLLPKRWHKEIGGFDETMESWEDCDYLLRLAWRGCCFYRIEEALWCYDFTSGKRRHFSYNSTHELMSLLQQKYDSHQQNGLIKMCGCDKPKVKEPMPDANEQNTLTVFYAHKNMGKHMVHGGVTKTRYGYYGGGALIGGVFKDDIRASPRLFLCGNCRGELEITATDVYCPRCHNLSTTIAAGKPGDLTIEDLEEPVEELVRPVDLDEIEYVEAGPETVAVERTMQLDDIEWKLINAGHLDSLRQAGVVTIGDVDRVGEEALREIHGIGPATAKELAKKAKKLLKD